MGLGERTPPHFALGSMIVAQTQEAKGYPTGSLSDHSLNMSRPRGPVSSGSRRAD